MVAYCCHLVVMGFGRKCMLLPIGISVKKPRLPAVGYSDQTVDPTNVWKFPILHCLSGRFKRTFKNEGFSHWHDFFQFMKLYINIHTCTVKKMIFVFCNI